MTTTEAPRRALVTRGGWDGHAPVETTDLFIPFLREQGFEVTVSDSLDAYLDAEALAGTDLVVQCWTMGEITDAQAAGLADAVRAGTGLAGWHGGICDAFRGNTGYQWLTGGQFVMHPAEWLDHTVDLSPAHADHPVLRGLPARIPLHTEQYLVHTAPDVEVLATTTFDPADPAVPTEAAGVSCPAVWTRGWGAGRVFVSTIGHKLDDLEDPTVRTLTERGLLWAAR
ncbi:ThuA domain-containing protein [Streptomyces sp. DSM 44915]|uniref:ThuA domain-containing protein n=1 Tax=Streptomyces chisholmiae TaxID=3075540 RepID=A0ABU2JIJ9_9ACTN|nr:ThuA domain-containing protein [Streptomyces sp. DSM 44915]MDT0264742.1 ThuA domain-containing protein [Streptomyces sp. DSM 44915]